jgi:thiol-disulfide isomerase/thioredoxin
MLLIALYLFIGGIVTEKANTAGSLVIPTKETRIWHKFSNFQQPFTQKLIMKKLQFAALAILMISCAPKEPTPIQLAQKIAETYSDHGSVSYDIDYRMKYFSEPDDTVKVRAHVDLVRVPEDTIFGGHIWISTEDSIRRYYDTSSIYIASLPNEKITRYKKEDDWAINGNVTRGVIETYFLDPERLLRAVDDSTVTVQLESSELNGTPVWHWASLFDDDDEFTNRRKDIWINRSDLSILKVSYTVDFQGENQYNEWNLSNVVFGGVQPEELRERFAALEENYPIEDYKPMSQEERQPLAVGTLLPELSGELYLTKQQVSLSDHRGKLLLIDFWYMDCFPCIKAIPHLNKLHHQYAEKGLQVIGIDPFDNNEKDLKRMPNFLEKNTMDYPILFVDRKDVEAFKVFAYPTLYVVNREGEVVFSQIGFGEATGARIDSVIQVHL